MRFVRPIAVAVTAMTVMSCSGSGGKANGPVPIDERFVTADDAPGSQPDPVEVRRTTEDFDEFIAVLTKASIDADREEMTTVFRDAGFVAAGVEARFYGATHSPEASPHVFSTFIELGSEDGVTSALDWLETDSMKPCPFSCATDVFEFDVDGVVDARGVHRIATAEDVAAAGAAEQRPHESYWVAFSDGSVVYTVDLQGPPGSVSEQQAQDIAIAFHERLTEN